MRGRNRNERLSEPMRAALGFMADGWLIRRDVVPGAVIWDEERGRLLSLGDKTVDGLVRRGLIDDGGPGLVRIHRLTERGRTVAATMAAEPARRAG